MDDQVPALEAELASELARHAPLLRRHIEARIPPDLRGQFGADDVLQLVWLSARQSCATGNLVERPRSARVWFEHLATNQILRLVRDARRLKRGGGQRILGSVGSDVGMARLENVPHPEQRTPSSIEAAAEARAAVRAAVGDLPDNYREAVSLNHLEDRTRAEAAEQLQTTRQATNSLVYRGMKLLKQALGRSGEWFKHGSTDDGRSQDRTDN